MKVNETTRRILNMLICYAAWTGAIGLALFAAFGMSREEAAQNRWIGLTVILLMGVAITASLIRSRYKLAEVISEVFLAGVRTGRTAPSKDDNETK